MALDKMSASIIAGSVSILILIATLQYLWGTKQPTQDHLVDEGPFFVEKDQSAVAIALANALPDCVFTEQSATYKRSVGSYYAANCTGQRPGCVVRPTSTKQVATAIKTIRPFFNACYKASEKPAGAPLQFAIRSGGHAFEGDMSSIDGGFVLDLGLLKTIEVAEDCQTTVIGTGNRWADVSAKLDTLGLAVVGGRDAGVGVGGLLLGGGISYLSPRMGMACDNVVDYEIVLADGTITHANESQNPDLWKALKGGSGNFGIVTHFTSATIPLAKLWAGYFYWPAFQIPKLLRAFYDFNRPESFDECAAGPILAMAYVQRWRSKAAGASIVYTKPEPWPETWKPFNKIWRIWSTAGIKSLSDATQELHVLAPYGLRQTSYTTTVKNNLESVMHFEKALDRAIEKVKNVYNVTFPLVVQPLTPGVFRKGSPNVLGLETRNPKDSFVIVSSSASWVRPEDDELVIEAVRTMIEEIEAFAEARGAGDSYRYLNYASKTQDPFKGYGEKNLEFMQQVSRKYDPDGMFQRAVPGGFKLGLY